MDSKNTSYDSYIENAQPFAQPILRYLRETVHEACVQISEEMKWSMPCFAYKKGILCTMAAFKNHVSFGFWLGAQMSDAHGVFQRETAGGMGHFGKIKSIADLPDKAILIQYLNEAMQLADAGVKISVSRSKEAKVLSTPEYFEEHLAQNVKAKSTFEAFSQSHKNEYIEWVTEAKTEATRLRRLTQMTEWLEEGKSRHWKYVK